MMRERYAELELYTGLVSDRFGNINEGPFYPNRGKWEMERWDRALEDIQAYFDMGLGNMIQILEGSLVDTDELAKTLVEFAMSRYPSSTPATIPESLHHGKIKFKKLIRFHGFHESEKNALIESMKESGFKPQDRELERSMLRIGPYILGKTDEERRNYIMKEEGIHPDRPWIKALSFF